jgi:hypothetical protein
MCETLHPFEEAGLGESPFRFVGLNKNVYSAAPGHIQAGGTCCYCGQGIMWECTIRSNDGKLFTVGCDCVAKLDRADNRLVAAVHRAKLKAERDKRDAEREARWAENRAKREAELQAQRDRNGGLTDRELVERQEMLAAKEKEAELAAGNAWLISVLKAVEYRSDFIQSMIDTLHRGTVAGLSPRCQSILKDIYAKHHGRRGSKKYDAAEQEFESRIEECISK